MEILESMSKELATLKIRVDYLTDTLGFLRSVAHDYAKDPVLGFQTLSALLFDKKLKSRVGGWIEEIRLKKERQENGSKKEK